MLPKCPICNINFVTAKSKIFARLERLDENICIYCLAKKTGKEIGRTGMIEASKFTPKNKPSYAGVETPSYQRTVKKCRPCLNRRKGS